MGKVMYVEEVSSIKEGRFLVYSDVVEPEIDNLDDLMIELGEDNLVYVEDNYQSPHRFKMAVNRKVTRSGSTRQVILSEPNHPLHKAPPLNDWIKANRLCASEVSFRFGVIFTEDTWNHNLKEI